MKLKKLMLNLMFLFMFLFIMITPGISHKAADAPVPEKNRRTEVPASVRTKQLMNRLEEIKAMDFRKMPKSEKRKLKRELRSIDKEMREINNGGVYISVGGIIIILLLLILLL